MTSRLDWAVKKARNLVLWTSSGERILKDKMIDTLWPFGWLEPNLIYPVRLLSTWSSKTLKQNLTGDPVFDNLLTNKWEFSTGKTELTTYPFRFSVPFSRCNAKCEFCTSWLLKDTQLSIEMFERLRPMIRHCLDVNLVGYGEPLIHPQFEQILVLLRNETDPRAHISLTTNGVFLRKWADKLLASNIHAFGISIHAASAQTHHDLMNLSLESYYEILDGIRYLAEKKQNDPTIWITVVFILMRQNIAELPRFIERFNEIGVDQIFIRTLVPHSNPKDLTGLNYHLLPPYLHPDFTDLKQKGIAAIKASKVPVLTSPETWDKPIFTEEMDKVYRSMPPIPYEQRMEEARAYYQNSVIPDPAPAGNKNLTWVPTTPPDLSNPYNRTPPYDCPSPYTAFYIRSDGEIRPCCYIKQLDGYERIYYPENTPPDTPPETQFFRFWNSPVMQHVRETLNTGPLIEPCLHCPFYW
jgi:MoaA/NifB/PqqE/SkfB family radical SAM enzyme